MVKLIGVQLKLRFALEDDVVLVHLRIHRADLPLAESVIEGVVYG